MSQPLLELLAIVIRVWAIVRVHPWLRVSAGPMAEFVGLGLGLGFAGLTCDPEVLLGHAATILEAAPLGLIEETLASGVSSQVSPSTSVSVLHLVALREIVVREVIIGTLLGLGIGLVASAWLSVARSPVLSDLLAGSTSPALLAALANSACLVVFEVGAHHDALAALFEAAALPATGLERGFGWQLFEPRAVGSTVQPLGALALGLVSLCLVTVLGFVVSATVPILAIDATMHAAGVAAPRVSQVVEPFAVGIRAASSLLWLVTALSAMPAAWVDALLAVTGK